MEETERTGDGWSIGYPTDPLELLDASVSEHERPALTLDPRDRTGELAAAYGAGGGDGTPSAIWHGIVLRTWLPITTDPAAVRAYLEDAAGRALLDRIADGHDVVWNGSTHIGHLTEDGQEAVEALDAALTGDRFLLADEHAGVWEPEEWLGSVVGAHGADSVWDSPTHYTVDCCPVVTIDHRTSDADLAALAEKIDADARGDAVVLSGTFRYLERLRERCVTSEELAV